MGRITRKFIVGLPGVIVGLPRVLLKVYQEVYCMITRGVNCRVTRRFIAGLPGGLL